MCPQHTLDDGRAGSPSLMKEYSILFFTHYFLLVLSCLCNPSRLESTAWREAKRGKSTYCLHRCDKDVTHALPSDHVVVTRMNSHARFRLNSHGEGRLPSPRTHPHNLGLSSFRINSTWSRTVHCNWSQDLLPMVATSSSLNTSRQQHWRRQRRYDMGCVKNWRVWELLLIYPISTSWSSNAMESSGLPIILSLVTLFNHCLYSFYSLCHWSHQSIKFSIFANTTRNRSIPSMWWMTRGC